MHPQETAGPPRRGGYGAVFAVPEFRALFAAHLLSLLGVVVGEIALSLLVYRLTGSPLLAALTFALGFLPYAVAGTLLAGVADRYPARRVLVVCDLLCAGCAAAMVLPGVPVAGLLALRCLTALVAPVFTGTRAASLGDILGEGDLFVLGRSLIRIVSQAAQLAGFAAGGLLIAALSPRGALGVTVVTFLGSALLLRLGTRRRPARGGGAGPVLRSSLSGTGALLADRRIRALLLLFWLPPLFVVAPEALAAPYADAVGAGPAALGLLMCGMPVGAVTGELLAGAALGPRGRSRIVLPLAAVSLLPLLGFALRPSPGWALPLLALAGSGMAYTLGLDRWFVDAVPEELRGRAMTLLTAGLMTIQGLGMALAGFAAEFAPAHAVVAGAGALGTACALLAVREVRRSAPRPGESDRAQELRQG
ncbi:MULTISPECIES: MFS transporter [Streptomyces]|uniref:MFS transporter n=1 Tax=Streptomyces lycii TaxID=2654337 RepID=A0ABQ7FN70_9ACTN|nr:MULTISPECIES: MFS transporter [Streptomyces]KAF4409438.1 MFS transporter [Streptomyces lycii]PGH48229.1 MFS transporter [Streptomyces sp. Ru87]